eukprot:11208549-Karenia_brevis.AAC.1
MQKPAGSGLRLLTPFPVQRIHWTENSVLLDLCDPYRTLALGPSELSWPPRASAQALTNARAKACAQLSARTRAKVHKKD